VTAIFSFLYFQFQPYMIERKFYQDTIPIHRDSVSYLIAKNKKLTSSVQLALYQNQLNTVIVAI